MKLFKVAILLLLGSPIWAQAQSKLSKITSDSVQYYERFASSVSVFKSNMVIGSPGSRIGDNEHCGKVNTYELIDDEWELKQILIPENYENSGGFGSTVILGENFLFVSGRIKINRNYYNLIVVYKKTKTGWIKSQNLRLNHNYRGRFGYKMELDENQLIVSTSGNHYNEPTEITTIHAAIFEFNGDEWKQSGVISSSNFDKYHKLENEISISGNKAFIHGYYSDPDAEPAVFCTFTARERGKIIYQKTSPCKSRSDRVFVFTKTNGNWVNTQIIKSPVKNGNREFGTSMTSQGDTLIIGANACHINDNEYLSGAVHVFVSRNGTYHPVQTFSANDQHYAQMFGEELKLQGNHLVVGCENDHMNEKGKKKKDRSGAAYIFTRNQNGEFHQSLKIVDPNRSKMGYFGRVVDVYNGQLICGSAQKIIGSKYGDHHDEGAAFSIKIPSFKVKKPKVIEDSMWVQAPPLSTDSSLTLWEKEQTQVKLYPNPNNGSFTIRRTLAQESQVRIIDVTGKLVYECLYKEAVQVIHTPNLSEGIYFAQIITGHKQQTLQFVITR